MQHARDLVRRAAESCERQDWIEAERASRDARQSFAALIDHGERANQFPGNGLLARALRRAKSSEFRSPDLSDSVAASLDAPSEDTLSPDAHRLIDTFCQQAPDAAFAFAVNILSGIAETMQSIVDETRRDLVEIEIRRKQIDRTQERTREILRELTGIP
jgi:hypothetical protein